MNGLSKTVKSIAENGKARYLALYTALFALVFTVGFSVFIFGNSTFLHYHDALLQHYPSLIYAGEYLRALPGHLANGVFPMYDFSIGLGDDVFMPLILHHANIDIFNLLFAFVPREGAYAAYVIVVVLRLYFSGLTFSYFCHTVLKADKRFVLLGALIYVFSGWTCVNTLRHPSFIIALMYLPLITAEFDKVLQNKKPYLFIISVFLFGLTGFYWLYMVTVLLIIYALIRLHILYNTDYLKSIIRHGLTAAGYYFIGLLMAAVVIVPMLITHFSIGREAVMTTENLLLYPLSAYLDMFLVYPSPVPTGDYLNIIWYGMSAIVPVALILLFFYKPYRKHLMLGVSIAVVLQLFPIGSYILNGFGYVTNRSEFLFSFVYCMAVVIVLSDLFKSENKDSAINNSGVQKPDKRAVIAILVYILTMIVAIFIAPGVDESAALYHRVGWVFVIVFSSILLIPSDSPSVRFMTAKRKPVILGIVVIISIIVNVSSFYMFKDTAFIDESAGDIYEDYVNISELISDDSFYRQSTPFTIPRWHFDETHYVNAAMLFGYHGVSEYWSYGNPAYTDFSYEMENIRQLAKWRIHSLDNRTVLNELASVKYIFSSNGIVPYGYEPVAELFFRNLYQNKYALPLGYTYDKIISITDYVSMGALDKQETLMQAAVLPQEYANTTVSELTYSKKTVPYTPVTANGVVWENGNLDVIKDVNTEQTADTHQAQPTDGIIELQLHNQAVCTGNCETYVHFAGLGGQNRGTRTGNISVTTNLQHNIEDSTFFTKFVDEYQGRDDHLLNLGYSEEPVTNVKLQFSEGNYTLESIEVYCVPMDDYAVRALALREDVLEKVEIGVNTVKGSITLESDKVLVLSIPYSKGWRCTVNGESVELLRANTAFMAIPLTAGNYDIELSYETPGLKIGAVITLSGIIAFITALYAHRRKCN